MFKFNFVDEGAAPTDAHNNEEADADLLQSEDVIVNAQVSTDSPAAAAAAAASDGVTSQSFYYTSLLLHLQAIDVPTYLDCIQITQDVKVLKVRFKGLPLSVKPLPS